VPDRYRVEYITFDRETFWLGEPARDAQRLRPLIASKREDAPILRDR